MQCSNNGLHIGATEIRRTGCKSNWKMVSNIVFLWLLMYSNIWIRKQYNLILMSNIKSPNFKKKIHQSSLWYYKHFGSRIQSKHNIIVAVFTRKFCCVPDYKMKWLRSKNWGNILKRTKTGAPGWFSQLSLWLLIFSSGQDLKFVRMSIA